MKRYLVAENSEIRFLTGTGFCSIYNTQIDISIEQEKEDEEVEQNRIINGIALRQRTYRLYC